MTGSGNGKGPLWALVAAAVMAVVLSAAWRPVERSPLLDAAGSFPQMAPSTAWSTAGTPFTLRSSKGGELLLAMGADAPLRDQGSDRVTVQARADTRRTARLLATPTALQWRHPLPGLPSAMVLRAAERDPLGRIGPPRLYTKVFADHGSLPVLSLLMPEGALFDPDTGIYVVGHAMMDPPPGTMRHYLVDGRWWKYPGNFHGRGREWERRGLVQLIDPDGAERFHAPVRVRINGQMTRGFPQHALRLLFDEPLPVPVFGDGEGRGSHALILRSGGNDQVKAMMRDALLQELCAGLPFEVSRASTCVVYINGAYWGVHHLRQRLNEKELARRYGVPEKRIALMELRMTQQVGEKAHADAFAALVSLAESWDGADPAVMATLEERVDVEGFLTYMAAMMVLGNKDWPGDNVKYWRYMGPKGTGKPLDGRWYFVSGDLDLGFGANHPPTNDLLEQVKRVRSPISRLFNALMRSPEQQRRFTATVQELLDGPLATERLLGHMDALVARMDPEMERHTARWRKPVDAAAWHLHVEVMRRFAERRGDAVRAQLDELVFPQNAARP